MGYNEYDASRQLALYARGKNANAFYALLMAAMREADTDNLQLLGDAFPEILAELRARYNAPGGYLPGEYPVNLIPNNIPE